MISRRLPGLWIASAILVLALACSDQSGENTSFDDPNVLNSIDKNLIFGTDRDVEQSRGQWRHAENAGHNAENTGNNDERLRMAQLVQTALASRGTGGVIAPVYSVESDCTKDGIGHGSGLLSSSTRFVTARHVAEPKHGHSGEMNIYFEATGEPNSTTSFRGGEFVPDATSNGTPLFLFDRGYSYQTKFGGDEENPLLANRLASLGLEEIGKEGRRFLRGPWPFAVDESPDGPKLDYEAVYHPDRLLDITVLKAESRGEVFSQHRNSEAWPLLSTGSWGPIDRPGIFFDYQPFQSLQNMKCSDDEFSPSDCPEELELEPTTRLYPEVSDDESATFTKLWSLHHQWFPDSEDGLGNLSEESVRTNLISNPFPYVETGTSESTDYPEKGIRHSVTDPDEPTTAEIKPYCVAEGADPLELPLGDVFPISLDAITGSSGGGVLQPQRKLIRNSVREHPALVDPAAVQFGSDATELETTDWTIPIPQDQNGNYENYILANPISDQVARWGGRDRGEDSGDPFNPIPDQPPSDGEPPKCQEQHDGKVLCTPDTVTNDAFPDIPPSGFSPYDWDGDGDPDEREREHESSGPVRTIACGHSHPSFAGDSEDMRLDGVGVASGFIGSVRYNPDFEDDDVLDEDSTVGFLRMVCAPWSSVPFVQNWPFLRTAGTSYFGTKRDLSTNTREFRGFGDSLSDALVNFAEWRYQDETDPANDERYLRPMSMKTCPPNYFLNGLRFQTRPAPSGDHRVLSGITELKCQLGTESSAGLPYNVTRPLDLDPDEGSCTFTMGDQCFSRSQFIGIPRDLGLPECGSVSAPQACVTTTTCGQGKVVSGWRYSRDEDGMIDQFALDCLPEPGSQ